jgi:hypothetical protein
MMHRLVIEFWTNLRFCTRLFMIGIDAFSNNLGKEFEKLKKYWIKL